MVNKKYTKVISAGIIVFRWTPQGPRFLLLYRDRGVWDFPRGRMEVGERSWQTAFREVEEETGLKAADLRLKSNFKVFEKFPYQRRQTTGAATETESVFKIVIFYLAETNQAKVVLSKEHEGYGWFLVNQAQKMLARYKNRVKILRQAYAFIKHQQSFSKEQGAVAAASEGVN